MARICDRCGKEGTFKEIKTVDLPVSGSTKLCHACSTTLFKKEHHDLLRQQQLKEDVLRRFPEPTLKQFCRDHDIPTSEQRSALATNRRGTRQKKFFTYHYNFDELLRGALRQSSLQDVLAFAKKKHIPTENILANIEPPTTTKHQERTD